MSPPSQSRSVPYFFGSLRTKNAGSPVAEDSMVASGTPPSSSPARPSIPAGHERDECLDDLGQQSPGSDSKRYLSK